MDSDHARTHRRVSVTNVRLMAAGLLLLQLVWVFAVPPFRSTDEFDHAYRAASVARGEWMPDSTNATRGTGAFVTVPDDIVAAARPECSRLPYTFDNDCIGTRSTDGTVVSSGAGRYHPVFYALIGTAALPFDGATALYAMRLANVLLCWIALAAALAALRTWATGAWPFVGFALVCSPMVIFNASVAAPNGFEMAASVSLWAALLGIARDPAHRHRGLMTLAVLSSVVVVTLRSLGPLWVLLIVVAVCAVIPHPWTVLKTLAARRDVRLGAAVVALATAASLAWILSAASLVIGTLKVPDFVREAGPVVMYTRSMLLWVLQSIGAFPYRDTAAPPLVYVAYLVPVVWLIVGAFRRGRAKHRIVLASLVTLSLAIPLTITIATIDRHGLSWNGGYTIPFSMGIFLVSGVVLNDRSQGVRNRAAAPLFVAYATAHVVALWGVLHKERDVSPSVANGNWVLVPVPVLCPRLPGGASALGGCGRSRARSATPRPGPRIQGTADRAGWPRRTAAEAQQVSQRGTLKSPRESLMWG